MCRKHMLIPGSGNSGTISEFYLPQCWFPILSSHLYLLGGTLRKAFSFFIFFLCSFFLSIWTKQHKISYSILYHALQTLFIFPPVCKSSFLTGIIYFALAHKSQGAFLYCLLALSADAGVCRKREEPWHKHTPANQSLPEWAGSTSW